MALGAVWVVAIALALVNAPAHAAQVDAITNSDTNSNTLQLIRLKPADPELRRLIAEGHRRSSMFRDLVEIIHGSNVIVAVQFGFCGKGRFRSCVVHVEGDARQRHIRVRIQTRTTEDRMIATIAHELQHALEIAADPEVTSAEAALKLYRRLAKGDCRTGWSDVCETEAALAVEDRVLDELEAEGRERRRARRVPR
ncbi:MAG: hypothetical protein ACT4QD_15575 [Acidobacteriota bacterium]